MNDNEVTVYLPSHPLEQEQAHQPEVPAEGQRDLGPCAPDWRCQQGQRKRPVQPGLDSKLRGCDLVWSRVMDVARGGEVLARASVVLQKTREPVRFELAKPTRVATKVCRTTTASTCWRQVAELVVKAFVAPRASLSKSQRYGPRPAHGGTRCGSDAQPARAVSRASPAAPCGPALDAVQAALSCRVTPGRSAWPASGCPCRYSPRWRASPRVP